MPATMQKIEYRVTYSEGEDEVIEITTRDINSGYPAVLKAAKRFNRLTGKPEEIVRVEFWQVKS